MGYLRLAKLKHTQKERKAHLARGYIFVHAN